MKSRIIDAMMADSKSAHMTRTTAEVALATVFRAITTVTQTDGSARVPEFGTFYQKHRPGRLVKTPTSGEPVHTAAKTVITFKQPRRRA